MNVFEQIDINFFNDTHIIDSPIVDTKIAPKEDYEDTTTLDTSNVSKVEGDDTSMGLEKNTLWSRIKIPVYEIVQTVITACFKHDSYEIIVYEWFLTREINKTNLTEFEKINVSFYGDVFFGEDILFRKFQFTVLMILCSYLLGGIMYISFTWTYYIISILLETVVLAVIYVKIKQTHGLDAINFDFTQI